MGNVFEGWDDFLKEENIKSDGLVPPVHTTSDEQINIESNIINDMPNSNIIEEDVIDDKDSDNSNEVKSVDNSEISESENNNIENNEDYINSDNEDIDLNMFGTPVIEEGAQINDIATKNEGPTTKKSFAEAHNKGNRTKKLNKKVILYILFGASALFILVFNILMESKKKDKVNKSNNDSEYVDVNDFGIGIKYQKKIDEPVVETEVSNEAKNEKPIFNVDTTPPTYSERKKTTTSGNSGSTTNNAVSSTIDSIKAPIRKNVDGIGNSTSSSDGGMLNIVKQPFKDALDYEVAGDYSKSYSPEIQTLLKEHANTGKVEKDEIGRIFEHGNYEYNNNRSEGIEMLGDNTLFPGTIIHAVLVSRIDTEYPSDITARVIENVYDSKTGKNLLIPQGSILKGGYSSSSLGIAKVQIAWTEIIINYDGFAYRTSLGGMAGVDRTGRAGISGSLNNHYWEYLKAAGMISLFTIINSEIGYTMNDINNETLSKLMAENKSIVDEIGNKMIDRALDIDVSVKVPNGKPVSVSVNTPLKLVPFKMIKAKGRYKL